MSYKEKISNKLNELMVKNYTAEKGYRNAIDNITDDRLKLFFNRRVNERNKFAKELKQEILKFDDLPEDLDNFKGYMFRNGMPIKTIDVENKEQAVLDEVIKGEQANLKKYKQVLKNNLFPPATDSLLVKHKKAIQASLNTEKSYVKIVS